MAVKKSTPSPLPDKKNILVIVRIENPNMKNERVWMAIDNFKGYFKHFYGSSVTIKTLGLSGFDQDYVQIIIDKERPDLIYLININVPDLFNFITDIPVIHALGLSSHPLGDNFTGIDVYVRPGVQLAKLQKALPTIKRVGLFYSKYTEKFAEEARKAARKVGIELVTARLTSEKELDAEFEKMFMKQMIQGFWIIPDEILYNRDLKKREAFVQEVGKMGVSILSPIVDDLFEGALISVEIDPLGIGKQSAEMAVKILFKGVPAKDIPTEHPRYLRTTISLLVLKKVFLRHSFNSDFFNDEVFILEREPDYHLFPRPPYLYERENRENRQKYLDGI